MHIVTVPLVFLLQTRAAYPIGSTTAVLVNAGVVRPARRCCFAALLARVTAPSGDGGAFGGAGLAGSYGWLVVSDGESWGNSG